MIRSTLLFLCLSAVAAGAARAEDTKAGEELFKRKCMMCHRLSEGTKVGPGLAGVTTRRSEQWLDEWLQDPKAMVEKGDPIAVELLAKHKKVMSTVAAMQDKVNRENVIAFLKENDEKIGAAKNGN